MEPYEIITGDDGFYFQDLNDYDAGLQGPFDSSEEAEQAAIRFFQHK